MPLWTMTDNANGVPLSVGAQFNVAPTALNNGSAANSTVGALYGNTTASAYYPGKTTGVFSVNDTEKNAANVSSEAKLITHTGWVIRTVGSGGRAGRVHYETLVAGTPSSNGVSDDLLLPQV